VRCRLPLLAALAACLAAALVAGAGGAASASGRGRIVFTSTLPVYPVPENLDAGRIYSVGVDGRGRLNLSGDLEAAGDELASLSPDRTKIAFLRSRRSDACGCEVSDLWLMNADGTSQRRLLSPAAYEGFPLRWRAPAWSPDGATLAVNAFSNAGCRGGPYLCTSDYYAVLVDLTGKRLGVTGFNPAWSPDGQRLAYQVDEIVGDGTYLDWQIGVSNADGSASHLLAAAQAVRRPADYCWFLPSWSTDGRRIAFALKPCEGEAYPNRDRLYIAPADGTTTRMLPRARDPVWSPDGSRLAFVRNIDERSVLFMAGPGGGQARRITSLHEDATAPLWSPDGRWLAFQRSSNGSSQIYVVDGAGTSLRRVTREPPSSRVPPFAWSADSRRLLYPATVETADSELWTMNPDGSALRRLTSNARPDYEPAWSSDGMWLAFVHDHQPDAYSNYFSIYAIRSNGEGSRPVTPGKVWDGTPMWSPDRRRIAFLRDTGTVDDSDLQDLFVVEADGSRLRRLTLGGYVSPPFAWSPNGRQIALEDGGALFVVKPDGGSPRRLTRGAEIDGPAWSPDGSAIAFTSCPRVGRPCSVRAIRPDGKRMRVLHTTGAGRAYGLAWSRDGKRIAFSADLHLDARDGLYVMNRDGTGVVQIVEGVALSHPSWSPDGRRLVFTMGTQPSVYIVDADGGNLTELTPFAASSTSPNWSPRP
jgi:Tol biopolymer transport system component